MRKIILIILVLGVVFFGLVGCGTKNEFDIGKESNVEIAEKGVLLSIKENTLTKKGATLILKNDSNVEVQYGEPYEVEIKKDGKWYKINVELNFILPVYGLKSKESKEIKLNWENSYGELSAGDYRIIKSVDVENENGTFDRFYISAEFTIE
ncbi:MAG: hypothetical protein IJO33_00455 [Bacilli bacterium]|nr:hypothetical protein [Bacilli bacterium]